MDTGSTSDDLSDEDEADGGTTGVGMTDTGTSDTEETDGDGAGSDDSGGPADGSDVWVPAIGDPCITDESWGLLGYFFGGIHVAPAGSVGYYDCSFTCVAEDVYYGVEEWLDVYYGWWGDGECDDGLGSPADFDCVELEWDVGDCDPPTDTDDGGPSDTTGGATDAPGSPCSGISPDGVAYTGTRDCSDACVAADLTVATGDGICDDGSGAGSHTYIDLLCDAFLYDRGDCEEDESGAPGVSFTESEVY